MRKRVDQSVTKDHFPHNKPPSLPILHPFPSSSAFSIPFPSCPSCSAPATTSNKCFGNHSPKGSNGRRETKQAGAWKRGEKRKKYASGEDHRHRKEACVFGTAQQSQIWHSVLFGPHLERKV